MKRRNFLSITALGLAGLPSCKPKADSGPASVIRFGHFPNITHVQGLVAQQLSRRGEGWFEKRLGVKIEWFSYNAGPSATEAIFAGALDVTYIGPSPTLNAYSKSKGTEMRVLAGAANGGNALVIHPESGITKPEDFRGKKIGSPQLGNTQDVQLRAWLGEHGIKVTLTGGDATVVPTENPNQLALLQQKGLDAVWTAEPWVTRLELEAGAKIFYQDTDTNVTLLASSAAFVKTNPDLAKKLAGAHRELTAWIKEHPAETRALIKAELTEEMKAAPKDELLDRSLARVVVTDAISRESLDRMVASAQKVGFLKEIPDLANLLPQL
jgi:NitT/TauT family transport system substrate-binding protein